MLGRRGEWRRGGGWSRIAAEDALRRRLRPSLKALRGSEALSCFRGDFLPIWCAGILRSAGMRNEGNAFYNEGNAGRGARGPEGNLGLSDIMMWTIFYRLVSALYWLLRRVAMAGHVPGSLFLLDLHFY